MYTICTCTLHVLLVYMYISTTGIGLHYEHCNHAMHIGKQIPKGVGVNINNHLPLNEIFVEYIYIYIVHVRMYTYCRGI